MQHESVFKVIISNDYISENLIKQNFIFDFYHRKKFLEDLIYHLMFGLYLITIEFMKQREIYSNIDSQRGRKQKVD